MGSRQGSHRFSLLVPLLLVALSVGLALAACGGSANTVAKKDSGSRPKQGGTYNYPLSEDPGTFGPFDWNDVTHELYDGLVRWEQQADGTLKTAPCLAESWSGNADSTVWTFKLRPGVMFQAPVSREMTAADVVADLRYIADPANEVWIAYPLAPLKGADPISGWAAPRRLGVQALDRYTVRFTLKRPYAEFPDTLGEPTFWVWPADYLRKVGLSAYAQHPVGTGPYRFLRRAPDSIDLARNPDWWDTSGGPYIDTIHYEIIGSAPATTLAFQKGLVDWATVPVGQVAASRSLPEVKSGRWAVDLTPGLGLRYMFVNMKDPLMAGARGLALRQALTYGCDRQAVSAASSGGVFLPATTGVVPPSLPGAHDVQEPYPYDPAKAKALMQGVGPVTLTLVYPVGQQQLGTVASLTAGYAEIGITIKAKGIPFQRALANPEAYVAGSQLFFSGWVADYPSMYSFLYPLFDSHSGNFPGAPSTHYANPEVDALLAKARATTDPAARVQVYGDAERQILADAPAVPLIVFADARLLNNRVANVRFTSMGWVDLWRAWVK